MWSFSLPLLSERRASTTIGEWLARESAHGPPYVDLLKLTSRSLEAEGALDKVVSDLSTLRGVL